MRFETRFIQAEYDSRVAATRRKLANLIGGSSLSIVDVYMFHGLGSSDVEALVPGMCNPVVQEWSIDHPLIDVSSFGPHSYAFEIRYKPGVTNPMANTIRRLVAARFSGKFSSPEQLDELVFQTARQYVISSPNPLTSKVIGDIKRSLYNHLIEDATVIDGDQWKTGSRFPSIYPGVALGSQTGVVQEIDILSADDGTLVEISQKGLLALTLEEMKAIQSYYLDPKVQVERSKRGLSSNPSDVELEMLAQSWSEHCKHKIFAATVHYKNDEAGTNETINGLFKSYIKRVTDELAPSKPDMVSVFHDNSGVFRFDETQAVCFKVETHNSPSALDPYGGAITGIVGVNRDVLGTGRGAKPIFNTNYLCFGYPDTKAEDLPSTMLHPKEIMHGVHHGIIDGGNQSGIPTVAGGFAFDPSFRGKPLVFCGTGGVMPLELGQKPSWEKWINPGDSAVVIGGRVGKDGIHGATFSSLVLDETSPSSAVQIGDPITQKILSDFLLEARDLGLFNAVTDNGAGGLSSSFGEMASYSGGVSIDLAKVPLKYSGLAPWEIWVSESQERMSFAVPQQKLKDFLTLAKKRGVEAAEIGEFTDHGTVELFFGERQVALLDLSFVEDGVPTLQLEAHWPRQKTIAPHRELEQQLRDHLPDLLPFLLAEPNIASKEDLIRQYDHEVQGRTIQGGFNGPDQVGPSDGGVLVLNDKHQGLSVTHGFSPRLSPYDAKTMAMVAVDEAYRSHIALGGNPDKAYALDNFCWPDPVYHPERNPDGTYKMAQLVRANQGLYEACSMFGAPLISGKDSMKNDAWLEGRKISIKPTLLVSLCGIVDDVRRVPGSDFKRPGDRIFVIGTSDGLLGGSYAASYLGENDPEVEPAPSVDLEKAMTRYRVIYQMIQDGLIASIHDISDGGLLTAVAESAIASGLGASMDLSKFGDTWARQLFSESPSRFVVSVSQDQRKDFILTLEGSQVEYLDLGTVEAEEVVLLRRGSEIMHKWELPHLTGTFKGVWKQ